MESNWYIEDYITLDGKRPVLEFIESLPVKDQYKVRYSLELLAQSGIQLREPHAKAIRGENNLFELRTRLANNIQRIFYFHHVDNRFILLHGFTKKTQKTPPLEIETAKKRKEDYLLRHKEKQIHGAV